MKQYKKKKNNLDCCFYYEPIKYRKVVNVSKKKVRIDKKNIWLENFVDAFPDYKYYCNWLRHRKFNGSNVDEIKQEIDYLDKVLNKYI